TLNSAFSAISLAFSCLIGETRFCKNLTRDQYCASHTFKIRKGVIISQPCKGCGRGTKSSVQLCVQCGQ
ncbi:hypothetical protein RhiirC2_857771, partial [Rhizophagus irregularis]